MSSFRRQATKFILGRTLPSIKFFEPTSRFLLWMEKNWNGKLIYDVGAGCGHVSQELSRRGLEVVAIDINHRECKDGFPVEIADGESYEYEPGSVVMICRPCHGCFVTQVISNAIYCGAAAVLYVGLTKNFEDDLGDRLAKFEKVLIGAGLEGEDVLQWKLEG